MGEALFRVGHQFPQFGGIDRDSDPAAIAVHRFRDAVNVRLVGRIACRGGQAKLNPLGGITGCVSGIFSPEFQFARLSGQIMTIPALEAQAGDPSAIGDIFQVDLPDVAPVNLDPTETITYTCMATYLGGIVVGATDADGLCTLRRLFPAILATFPADVKYLASMVVMGANLYIGAMAPNGNSTGDPPDARVYKWDGTDLTLEQAFGNEGPSDDDVVYAGYPLLGVYNGTELIAGLGNVNGGGLGSIWRRDGAGAWTELTLPGGSSQFASHSMAMGATKLYIGGTDYHAYPHKGQILSWDGATLTMEHEVTTSEGYSVVGALCYIAPTLYYAWVELAEDGAVKIGTFGGSTWTDGHKDFTRSDGTRPLSFVAMWEDDEGILNASWIWQITGETYSFLYIAHAAAGTAGAWVTDYGPATGGFYNYVQQYPQDVP